MPLTSKTFSQLIDFTRTSAATYVDQLGRIVPTPVSPNLITFTQEFDNAAWTKTNSGTGLVPSITTNAATAPDGTMTADLVTFNRGAGNTLSDISRLLQTLTVTSGLHTQSIWLKAATPSDVGKQLALRNVEGTGYGVIALTADWVRYSRTELGSVGNWQLENRGTVTADTSVSVHVWGAQLEQTPDANLTLGSEIATNGSFDSGSTGWNLQSGWSVSGGAASVNSAAAGSTMIRTSTASISGRIYRVTFTVTSLTSGSLSSVAGTNLGTSVTATGTYTQYVTANSADGVGVYAVGSTTVATVDNISVREVTAASPSTYTRNFGGRFPPRFDYDPVTLAPRGLLIEEQRTNLLVRSEEFDNAAWAKTATTVTANAATSPDGTVDADKLVETAATSSFHIAQTVTVTAGQALTGYAYFKAGERQFGRVLIGGAGWNAYAAFNLSTGVAGSATGNNSTGISASITPAGNGWYRCAVTATPPGGLTSANLTIATNGSIDPNANSYAGTAGSGIFVWGAQLEAGAFATSYIPTTTSQVTRTADTAAITGSNFSPWYNPVEGTFLVEATSTAGSARALTASAGAVTNQLWVQNSATSETTLQVYTAGAFVAQIGVLPAAANKKIAVAYKTNDFAAAIDGGAAATDTSGSIGTFDRLNIGANFNSSTGFLNGHIRSIRYYPTRLTNAQLQALTA